MPQINLTSPGQRTFQPAARKASPQPGSALRETYMVDTFSISALHLAIKVPHFSHSGHKNEKVTNYLRYEHVEDCFGAARRKIVSLKMVSLKMVSLKMVSLKMVSLKMVSLKMVSLKMVSLKMVSLKMVSLKMVSLKMVSGIF
eukprot:SAG31_NODE_571_length_13998_cov_4.346212_11_plen_143_part_00